MSYSLLTETEAWVQIYVFFKQKEKKNQHNRPDAAHEHQDLSSLIIYDTMRMKGYKNSIFSIHSLWERSQPEKQWIGGRGTEMYIFFSHFF